MQPGYKTSYNATKKLSNVQIADVALSLKCVQQYAVAQVTEDGNLAVLSGSNQYSVSDKVIRVGDQSKNVTLKQRTQKHKEVQH